MPEPPNDRTEEQADAPGAGSTPTLAAEHFLELFGLGTADRSVQPTHVSSSGSYDIRKGASGYATIMGSVAGFVIPTVILCFTIPHRQVALHTAQLTLATGLLVLSLLGCLASAFALSALAGEEKLTINLAPAAMYMGAGTILSIVSILGAFEIFAYIFLRPSAPLFAAMTVGGGMTGAIYNALSVVDDYELRHAKRVPDDGKGWFSSREHAITWTWLLAFIGAVPAFVGGVLFWIHAGIVPSTRGASRFAFGGLVLTVTIIVWGAVRTLHPSIGTDKGLGRKEAIGIQAIIGAYVLFLLLLLPS